MALHKIENLLRSGPIAFVRDFLANRAIGLVVEIKRIAVENGVPPESKRLVDLKVETDGCHVAASVPRARVCDYPKGPHTLRVSNQPLRGMNDRFIFDDLLAGSRCGIAGVADEARQDACATPPM